MRLRQLSIIGLVGVLGLLLGQPARAQNSTSGAIQGVITDKQSGEGLAGATVFIKGSSLQGEQTAITGGGGEYKVSNLPPGTYVVTVFYLNEKKLERSDVQVSINKVTPIYAAIDSTGGGEVIEIRGSPTVDPTSTTQGVTLDTEYTKNIPVPGRTFESALGAAPGTAGDGLGVSFSGSTSIENTYNVDGVNTTGLSFGTVGTPLINNFIEEIEIITGGYNAEYGRSTGGVINVVTKSGSNEFHGEVFANMSPGFLIATRERTPVESSSIDFESNLAYDADFGFSLGGPIIKDRVWFYVGFAPRLGRQDIERITKRRTDCRPEGVGAEVECDAVSADMYGDGSPDQDPETGFYIYEQLDSEDLNSTSTSYQFVSKVNFAVSPEHQGQVSLIGTPATAEFLSSRGIPSASFRDATNLTTDLSAKWTSKFNNNKTELEAVFGWHRATFQNDAADDSVNDDVGQVLIFGDLGNWGLLGGESMDTVTGCTDSAAGDPYPFIANCPDEGFGYAIGGPGTIVDDKEQRWATRLSGTQRVKAAGNHEIKAGLDVEVNRIDNLRELSGGVFYQVLQDRNHIYASRWVQLAPPDTTEGRFDNRCADGTGMDQQLFDCDFLDTSRVKGETFNWGAYLRDSWQILPNLTFNAGLRYEEQRLRYSEDLQDTVDPFTGTELGTNAMVMSGMWAPRVGLLYDWTKEGKSKIYGHWGRFYESIPLQINNRSFGGETFYRQVFDAATQCPTPDPVLDYPLGPSCYEAGENVAAGVDETIFGAGVLVAPGIKAQYLDETIFGVEYELLEDLKVGLSYQNRRLGRVLEDVSTDGADTYILSNPGEFSTEEENKLLEEIANTEDPDERARLEAQLEQFRGIRIFDKPRRDYNAVQLTATRRFSRDFFVQASYTYSRTQGNFPGLFSPDNGQVDPNISSQYDLIELLANREGPLPIDRPHYFKLDGYYKLDFKKAGQLTPGVRFRALSGTPVDALAAHHQYGFNESFILPRGAMGRTNFDASIDLHLGYGRNLARGMTLEVYVDVFNAFNRQGTFSVDETYTYDNADPIVGGEYEDLIWAKRRSDTGGETADPVIRNRNFTNTAGRYAPLSGRLGARLTF